MKKITLLIAFTICAFLVKAQEQPLTIQQEIDSFYEHLNTEDITTEILINKTVSVSDMTKYNGIFDTLCSYTNFKQMIFELNNAAINPDIVPAPEHFDDLID